MRVIAPYELPTRLIPAGTAARIDPARAALLVNDMQEQFLSPYGAPGSTMLATITGNIAALRGRAGRTGMPVFFAAQRHVRGLSLVESLQPGAGEAVLTKPGYSAFAGTSLAALLDGRDQLIITGVYAHLGVLATALDAIEHDILPFVIADAVADLSPAHHAVALRHIAARGGALATTAQLSADLPAHA